MANGTATRSAPTVAPRVYPVGRAVLLLGVCGAELAGRRLTVDGRRVQAVAFGRLALLVSFVDQQAYSVAEIERKRTDPVWLAREARAYENAVERAHASGPVLPVRFLTVFAHSDALEEVARESEARWLRALTRLGVKRECVVHLYSGPHLPPPADAYVIRVSARASRPGRTPAFGGGRAAEHSLAMWRACTGLAIATRRVASAPSRGALFSTALLLAEKDVAALHDVIERASAAGAALGLTAYLEGPRLPYTFVP